MIDDKDIDAFLEHHGIKGQKWGVRRDPKTGVRPLAKTLSKTKFGQLAVRRGRTSHPQAEKIGSFVREHPKTSASIIAGTAFTAATLIKFRGRRIIPQPHADISYVMGNQGFKRAMINGKLTWVPRKN